MLIALLTDIHGNREAFEACLHDARRMRADRFVFLGDYVGYGADQFWPGAMKSVTWDGKTYGVPTNNETMALIWNADLFSQAGLDPESPPATWDDLIAYSKRPWTDPHQVG